MTLKNSFLTDALENLKRRNWVFWISFLTFFCYFPGALLLILNNYRSQLEYHKTEHIMTRMNESVLQMFKINGFLPFLIICVAILIGIQAFSYLHDKKQVDFYHSQPVSRNRRFLVIWFNGIVIFLAAYLINMLLGMVVAGAYDCMTTEVFRAAMEGLLLYVLLFSGIYHIAIIAVMLTGHALVSLMAMVVLLGYEIAARALMIFYASGFFNSFSHYETKKIFDTLLSPIVTYYTYLVYKDSSFPWQQELTSYLGTSFSLLIMALLLGIISWLLYSKRPSESHGKSISFTKIKEPLKVLLLLLIGTFGSLVILIAAGGESVFFGIAGAIFFTFLGHAVVQLIYEVDFRAIGKKLPSAIISTVAVILIFLSFQYDFFKYDQYIPKQSRVESVSIDFAIDGYYEGFWILDDGTEIYRSEYTKNMMQITDLDPVYELLGNVINPRSREYYENNEETEREFQRMHVAFRMKNGKEVNRYYILDTKENLELINKIYLMEEYQLANSQILEDNFVEDFNIYTIFYENGKMSAEVSAQTIKTLIDAYCKDVKSARYEEVYDQIPVGKLNINGRGIVNPEFTNQWEAVIYSNFANTIDVLEQQGIEWEVSYDENYLDSVHSITVFYTDREAWAAADYNGNYEDYQKIITYQDKDIIRKILQNGIPYNNAHWVSGRSLIEEQYNVEIMTYEKEFGYGEPMYDDPVVFPTGQIPDVILQDFSSMELGSRITK